MQLLSDIDVSGKRIFLRADLDVPLKDGGLRIKDEVGASVQATRLVNLKPTVEYLLSHGAKQVVIAGHVDRPKGFDPVLSTKNLLKDLEKILSRSVTFRADFGSGDSSLASMAQLLLFENLRFWPGETSNDLEFAKRLAKLADVYVNEAFGNCHREHASMVALPSLLPHAAGLHLEEEVKALSGLLTAPKRPFVAVVGGAKIETKEPLIEHLAKIADYVLVGGEIAKELTVDPSTSLRASGSQFTDNSKVMVATLTADGKDISNESIHQFQEVIANAKTIVWNGPMGVFEEGFEAGTVAVAEAILASGSYKEASGESSLRSSSDGHRTAGLSVVGGGETTQFLASKGLLSRFSFVSSGGGAMLEFLSGKVLPGLKALD